MKYKECKERGVLNENTNESIQKIANPFLGRDITIHELRLLPFLIYTSINFGRFDMRHINMVEMQIIQDWESHEWLALVGVEKLYLSKAFYSWANEILWESYVTCKLEKDED